MANATEIAMIEGRINEKIKVLHWIRGEAKKVKDLKEMDELLEKYLDEAITQQNP